MNLYIKEQFFFSKLIDNLDKGCGRNNNVLVHKCKDILKTIL